MANLVARLAGSVSLVALTTLVMSAAQPAQKAAAQIAGAGSSAIQSAVANGFLQGLDYNPNGSGNGRADFAAGTVDFAASDNTQVPGAINLNAINIPVSLIGNLDEGVTVDDACAALTGGKPEGVTVIGRTAGSGTRNIVETACGPVVADQELGSNQAVLDAVAATPNSIGFVDTPAAGENILSRDFAQGPNYIGFRNQYSSQEKADAAKALCQFIVGDGIGLAVGYTAGADAGNAAPCDDIKGPDVIADAILNGAGATSIQPAVDAGFFLNNVYIGGGSGAGRTAFTNGTADFASADGSGVDGAVNVNAIKVPVSIITNVEGLGLTVDNICAALDSAISNGTAPEVNGTPIKIVHRADVSGTTGIINTFLAANCASGVQVPNVLVNGAIPVAAGGVTAAGNGGVIAEVQSTDPATAIAVGYADTVAANQAGAFIAADAGIGNNFIIFRSNYGDAAKAAAAVKLCQYVTGEGQALAVGLGYAPGDDTADACSAIGQ
jgi:ABC-type phosphate transport system substrate-binding protein